MGTTEYIGSSQEAVDFLTDLCIYLDGKDGQDEPKKSDSLRNMILQLESRGESLSDREIAILLIKAFILIVPLEGSREVLIEIARTHSSSLTHYLGPLLPDTVDVPDMIDMLMNVVLALLTSQAVNMFQSRIGMEGVDESTALALIIIVVAYLAIITRDNAIHVVNYTRALSSLNQTAVSLQSYFPDLPSKKLTSYLRQILMIIASASES